VTSRSAVEAELHGDPLGRGTLVTLLAAAIVALVLALAGLVLVLVGDLRDERGQFLDLEAQGAGPGLLRRLTRLRAGLVAAVGLLGGLVGGALLCALVVRLVAVTAGSGDAEPPLRLTLDWPLIVGAAAAYALAAALIVGGVTAGAFRRRTP
jgi:ABC-type antimicrobial peptide transport system permease subunit